MCYNNLMNKPLPTQDELLSYFDYSIITGELFNKGKSRGSLNTDGYRRVFYKCNPLLAHRVIWKMVTGEEPGDDEIHHINKNRDCNAFHNLDRLSHLDNMREIDGGCFPPYVSMVRDNCYMVRKKGKYYGSYKTLAEAVEKTKEI